MWFSPRSWCFFATSYNSVTVLRIVFATRRTNMENTFRRAEDHKLKGFSQEEEGTWSGPYVFIFATDPQPGLVDLVEGGDGSKWNVEIERTTAAVTAINQMEPRPKFLIIGGDIVDAFPGVERRSKQISDLQEAFSTLNCAIPIFIVSGNHDVGNAPTLGTMASYRKEFGEEYYSFWVGGVFYIVLNTQCIFNPSGTEELCNEQNAWLEQQLVSAKSNECAHVVMFMHIPLFIENADEDDSYFAIPKIQRAKLLEDFAEAGIQKVFSGHYHRNAGGVWKRKNDNGSVSKIEMVVSSAIGAQLGTDKAGIRVVKVLKDDIQHAYHSLDDIPSSVSLN